jgi:hypothetical protein
MHYFYVTYETRGGEHEYRESGVLSALTVRQAEKKALKAKVLFDRPGWEEFCAYDSLIGVSEQEYQVLKKYTCDIDSYFDVDNKLRI